MDKLEIRANAAADQAKEMLIVACHLTFEHEDEIESAKEALRELPVAYTIFKCALVIGCTEVGNRLMRDDHE